VAGETDAQAPDSHGITGKSMSEQRKPRKIRHLWRALGGVLGVAVLLFAGLAYLAITGVTAPDWVRVRLENRLNAQIPSGRLHFSAIRLAPLGGGFNPQISLLDVELRDATDRLRAVLPRVTGKFDGAEMLRGQLRPVRVSLLNARVLLTRNADGQFDVSVGARPDNAILSERGNFGALTGAFEKLFETPLLSSLKKVESVGTSVYLKDNLSGRAWSFRNGNLVVTNAAGNLSASVKFKLDNPRGRAAEVTFGWKKRKGAPKSEFSARFSGLQTEDISDQVAVFNWLRVLDAPIGGAMTFDMQENGTFGRLHGVLDFGAGRVRQSPKTQPFRFSGAKAYFSYDPALEKFTFEQINVETEAGSLKAEGQAYLGDRIDRTVGALIGQVRLSKITLNPKGVFARPVTLDSVVIDARLRIDPLIVDIGQMVLVDGLTHIVIKGQVRSGTTGWTSALDLSANTLATDRLIALWPLIYKPKTRIWMQKNLLAGSLQNIRGALRAQPGQKPVLSLGFDLKDTSVRFIKTLPPIVDGIGYGVLADSKLHVMVEQGTLDAPDGSKINLGGSRFAILDTRVKNAPARVDLKTQSSVSGLLSLLDLPPFRFLSKAGVATDIAKGRIQTEGKITFPLSEKVTFDQVSLALDGALSGVSSDKLVRGKTLSASSLSAFVDNSELTISGSARLGRLPLSGVWRQGFGPENRGKSRLEGQVELSNTFLDAFGIALPKGTVKGRGSAHLVVDLRRGKAPKFRMISSLNRIRLALPAVGWVKPKNQKGRLEVLGTFGKTPGVSKLSIKTRGLSADGHIALKPGGKLDVAAFDAVNVGGWLKTRLNIRPGKDGAAVFDLAGGTLDLRKSRFASPRTKGRKGNRIMVRLDRLILSTGISLTNVDGALNTAGGMAGSFSGKVNGATRIKGTLAPNKGGTAVRFTSDDAGAVMRAAGVFQSAIGGRMDMLLMPSGKPGVYNGTLSASKVRAKNATALADILSAISVVGLLEQLGGDGILFNTVNARFRLSPTAVALQQSSAVGASLGLTMAGVYDFKSSRVDMQGVVTPIYLLNGILEQAKIFGKLFGKQKGEGLFGFTYTLKGAVNAPKVGVNPLSILTPGAFREIFRRPVPTEIGKPKITKKPPDTPVGGQGNR